MSAIKQSELFLQGAGDAWHERNRDKPRVPDPVLGAIEACKLQPKTVLELGCGNGWRLAEIDRLYKPLHLAGYDTSERATQERLIPNVFQNDALAALEKIKAGFYELVIFGFCLYLVDREDLMMIAAHADRVLKDGGHIIIHDFIPDKAHKRPYAHKEGVWTYKEDYSRYWPNYKHRRGMIYGDKDNGKWNWDTTTIVSVSQKNMAEAYPERQI